MARYHYRFPVNATPAESGATVTVNVAGTSAKLQDTIFADATSATTLANPFTLSGNMVSFWLAQPRKVKIVIASVHAGTHTVDAVEASDVYRNYVSVASGGHVFSWAPDSNA